MNEFQNKELTILLDKLSQETIRYSNLLTAGCTEQEFRECRESIHELQESIDKIKQHSSKPENKLEQEENKKGDASITSWKVIDHEWINSFTHTAFLFINPLHF